MFFIPEMFVFKGFNRIVFDRLQIAHRLTHQQQLTKQRCEKQESKNL